MPQFELQDIDSAEGAERIRARSAEQAVRLWLKLEDDAVVTLEEGTEAMDALEGWSLIRVAGKTKGRLRPFQRMRFRRD